MPGLDYIIPHSSDQPYDVLDIVRGIVDEGNFYEIMPDYARNIVIGFGWVGGRCVGIIANQPNQKAGEWNHDTNTDSNMHSLNFILHKCDLFVFQDVSISMHQ